MSTSLHHGTRWEEVQTTLTWNGESVLETDSVDLVDPPIRLRQNFSRSLIERERNLPGGGDLARYLTLVDYTVRW